MTDVSAPHADRAVVRAVRFPTTVKALAALGVSTAVFMPLAFVIVAAAGRIVLRGLRRGDEMVSIPASSVRSVWVGESRSQPPFPQVALAILVTVTTDGDDVDLPIVPVSADGKRSLTWNDAEVRELA